MDRSREHEETDMRARVESGSQPRIAQLRTHPQTVAEGGREDESGGRPSGYLRARERTREIRANWRERERSAITSKSESKRERGRNFTKVSESKREDERDPFHHACCALT